MPRINFFGIFYLTIGFNLIQYLKIMDELNAYILCGTPASGKSTWTKNVIAGNKDVVVICPDTIRGELSGNEADQSVSGRAFQLARERMEEALKNGKSVIIDATNMYRKTRKDWIDIAKKYSAKAIAVVFEVTEQTAIERNAKRASEGGRNVPTHVIQAMLAKYQTPSQGEGFDEVKFISKL